MGKYNQATAGTDDVNENDIKRSAPIGLVRRHQVIGYRHENRKENFVAIPSATS